MNLSNNIRNIKNIAILPIQTYKKAALNEIANAVAIAELNETISKMCYDDIQ